MVEKEDKFIVVNIKHLKEHQRFLDTPHIMMDRGNYISPEILKEMERDLKGFHETLKSIDNRNKYIVCNQDEPYAELVWQTILQGERIKKRV